jgi:hypothetical protein
VQDEDLAVDLASEVTVALRAGGYGIFPIAELGLRMSLLTMCDTVTGRLWFSQGLVCNTTKQAP